MASPRHNQGEIVCQLSLDNINGVLVEFSPRVNKSVDQIIINALNKVIKANITSGHVLTKI